MSYVFVDPKEYDRWFKNWMDEWWTKDVNGTSRLKDNFRLTSSERFLPIEIVTEANGDCFVRFEVPGVKKEDISLTVENQTLMVTAVRTAAGSGTRSYSFNYGTFHGQANMDFAIDSDKVKASLDNGILTVLVPRLNPQRPKTKTIAIE